MSNAANESPVGGHTGAATPPTAPIDRLSFAATK